MSQSQEGTSAGTSQSQVEDRVGQIKKKGKTLRSKITRSIKRVKDMIQTEVGTKRRLLRELEDINSDYSQVCEYHGELYEYTSENEIPRLDQWESELINEIRTLEEVVEDYVAGLEDEPTEPTRGMKTRGKSTIAQRSIDREVPSSSQAQKDDNLETAADVSQQNGRGTQREISEPSFSFGTWINELVEFRETRLPSSNNGADITVAEALFKLEASKDIPSVKLDNFSGDPLEYVDFIEKFKIHIHEKPQLSDDVRMLQLKMHLKGEAERALRGLGSSGKMYATALKSLHDQFGQPSVIARAYIRKVTCGPKIPPNNRLALREFYLDLANCVATLERIEHYSDANANENLRKIVQRMPNYLLESWKVRAADLRESGATPSLIHICEFVRKRVRAEFDPDFGDIERTRVDLRVPPNQGQRRNMYHQMRRPMKCQVCEQEHRVSECPTFRDCSVEERLQHVRDNRLCYSCLLKGHGTRVCRVKKPCGQDGCQRTHHRLLHINPPVASSAVPVLDCDSILPVVRVMFRAPNGRCRQGNVLIDSGAGTTVIRRDFAKALGLQGKYERLDLSVVGGEILEQKDSRRVQFSIMAMDGDEEYQIQAYEIDTTILSIPPLDRIWLQSFEHLKDIEFSHRAGPVDVILGVQFSHLHAETEIRQGSAFDPVAKRGKLGWYVIGADSTKKSSSPLCAFNVKERVDMEKFYEFETLGIQASACDCPKEAISSDDRITLELLEASCMKKEERYEIGLPWKRNPTELPNNYSLAEKRLESLERKLLKDAEKANLYIRAIKEYTAKEWAEPVKECEMNREPVYYLPHHGVYRPDKPSTPLRVVFDPACQFNGVSLNSFLYKGPCLIGNLIGVLLRFREQEIAIVGDISKMYLQILLCERDTHVHRFLWRNLDQTADPTVYRLLRVTFGDKPSPDMASYMYVILQIAKEHQEDCPDAANILRRDRYMDDLIHSCQTPEQAVKRIRDLDTMLSTGSFKIKEWFCSSEEVRKELKPDRTAEVKSQRQEIERVTEVDLDGEDIKTLGIGWNPVTDCLKFVVKDLSLNTFTKRTVLSKLSQLYDPLGLASPVTIRARMAMQDIWRNESLSWDDELPDHTCMCELWCQLFEDLERLSLVELPRCIKPTGATGSPEIHVFSDASGKAYGAVAYALWQTDSGPNLELIAAKARVAPLRQTTIPRLELMAALIASRLTTTIVEQLKERPVQITLWTDSQIVIHWIRSDSIRFKQFVGIRVAEIQSMWTADHWMFVPTDMNPADDLSRGISVDQMSGRWTCGPSFLRQCREEWPSQAIGQASVNDREIKKTFIASVEHVKCSPLFEPDRVSTWSKLLRVTAYCLRFVNKLLSKLRKETREPEDDQMLTVRELSDAEKYWVKYCQRSLGNWKQDFIDLAPFEDDSVIRVGGRLRRCHLPFDQIHPILMPAGHYISKLIMQNVHAKMGHVGPERTLCESRRQFWIARGRNMSKDIVHKCVVCRKLRQKSHSTLMSDLPPERLLPYSPPFAVTGIDLFGPFMLKLSRNKSTKAWGAIFTCANIRAVHLEIVADLSTQSFLQALRRFVAHHGWPNTIISDNGTSFVGTNRELRTLFQEGRKNLQDYALLHKVKWKFITPLSPHQGGLYESLIKQIKTSLKVAVGQQLLTWNEMSTVFSEVEGLMNSRPLGLTRNDPNDPQPLTPNHFVLGRASADVPQGPFQVTKDLRKRFEFCQMMVNQFWKRFLREYIPTLMRRSKWQTLNRQLQTGDIVLLVDYSAPRGKWDLAKIVETFPGKDGVVRNVRVKTKNGEYQRSIQKCCPILEAETDQSD